MKRTRVIVLCSLLGLAAAAPALAADAQSAPTAADFARLQADVAKLQQELREQKQLLLNVMQSEQQRYDVLLQLVRSGAAGAVPPAPAAALPGAVAPPTRAPEAGPVAAAAAPATISGRVSLPVGVTEAYVYVDGLRGPRTAGKTLEIAQKDKQFSPSVAVVPVGTKLVFPNLDAIFHNVFSNSSGNAFDLGSVKGGDRSRPVVVSKPGLVEVFCNIHSKMRAEVLVVPNQHVARVGADGTFTLPGVPVGPRKVVLWAPGAKSVAQAVDVTPSGAHVTLTTTKEAPRPHLNKTGQAYGSYDE
jgi:plastocyanin